jgi:hypothetical protein
MSSRLRQAYVAANLQDVPSPGLRARHSEAAAARSSAFVRALPCFSCTCGNTRIIVCTSMQVLSTYRFTVEEYHRLGEAGILGEDDRVELLNGDLITMAPMGGELCVVRSLSTEPRIKDVTDSPWKQRVRIS